jgi:hypothetical protein
MNSLSKLTPYVFRAEKSHLDFTAASLADACEKVRQLIGNQGHTALNQKYTCTKLKCYVLAQPDIMKTVDSEGWLTGQNRIARVSAYRFDDIWPNKSKLVREFSFPLPNYV